MVFTWHNNMKLLTHNMLTSHMKGVKNGYPLVINVRKARFEQEIISRP